MAGYFGLDILASILIGLNIWAMGKKYRWGFIAQTIGSLLTVIIGFIASPVPWGLVIGNLIFATLAMLGWYRWTPTINEYENGESNDNRRSN